jgi:hypothetical protein
MTPRRKSPFSATPPSNFAPPSSPFNSILERVVRAFAYHRLFLLFFFRYFSRDQTNFSRFRRTLSLISTVGFATFAIRPQWQSRGRGIDSDQCWEQTNAGNRPMQGRTASRRSFRIEGAGAVTDQEVIAHSCPNCRQEFGPPPRDSTNAAGH